MLSEWYDDTELGTPLELEATDGDLERRLVTGGDLLEGREREPARSRRLLAGAVGFLGDWVSSLVLRLLLSSTLGVSSRLDCLRS